MSDLKYLSNYLQISNGALSKINDLEIKDDSLSLDELLNCSSYNNTTLQRNNIWCAKVTSRSDVCENSSDSPNSNNVREDSIKNLLNMPFTCAVLEPKLDSYVLSDLLANINDELDPVADSKNNSNSVDYSCEMGKKIRSDSNNSDQSDSGIDVSDLYSSSEDQKGDSDGNDGIIYGEINLDPVNSLSLENNGHKNLSVDCKIKYSCDSNLSDLLSSICLEDQVDNVNSCIDDSKASLLNGFDLSDVIDYSVIDSIAKPRSDSFNETNEDEISLATLAKKHLSSSQPKSNRFTDESTMLNFTRGFDGCKDNSDEGISMSDLIASLDVTNSIVASEESISVQERPPSRNLDEFGDFDVDLTSCLKLDKDRETVDLNFNMEKVTFSEDINILPVPLTLRLFESAESFEKPRTNHDESSFAKALSCKPKQDKSAMLKVLNIQRKICNQFFNRPIPNAQIKPPKERIRQANTSEYIINSVGRRTFGRDSERVTFGPSF